MKLNYEKAIMEVITFDYENVIRTSLGWDEEGTGGEDNIGDDFS